MQKQNIECENYKKKLAESDEKLAALQIGNDNNLKVTMKNELSLQHELEEVKKNLTQAELKLQDRNRLIANQENQINALAKQVSSLKEVVAITKNLLEIRNTEVKHLQVCFINRIYIYLFYFLYLLAVILEYRFLFIYF